MPTATRPSARLKDSIVLLIDGMPDCDCQHVINAETTGLTTATAIMCDLEHACASLRRQLVGFYIHLFHRVLFSI